MWRSEALLAEAQNVGPTDLLAFLPRLLARLHVDVLYHVRAVCLNTHARMCVYCYMVVSMPRAYMHADK